MKALILLVALSTTGCASMVLMKQIQTSLAEKEKKEARPKK